LSALRPDSPAPAASIMKQLPKKLARPLTRPSFRAFSTSRQCLADHVRIVEVGPRDGLQNEKSSIQLETKMELIRRLAQTGVTHMEAGSFVPAKWVPQVRLSNVVFAGDYG
jgi:hydroxymethylglutaryl-CoA lyase